VIFGPVLTGIVGAIESEWARGDCDVAVEAMRIAGGDGDVDLRKILWQAVGQRMKSVSAVG